jgi:hypothetical protein
MKKRIVAVLGAGMLSLFIGTADAQTALVSEYCSGCHNDKTKAGGMTLTSLDLAHPEQNCHADVNALDKKAGEATSILHTNSRAYTPLHSAAARGDNEMIVYLVSKGARVDIVGKNGLTVADMANGPRERIQPFPETIKLLVSLGSKFSNRCISC